MVSAAEANMGETIHECTRSITNKNNIIKDLTTLNRQHKHQHECVESSLVNEIMNKTVQQRQNKAMDKCSTGYKIT